ncbi:MAG: dual specificity protein phosphatase family protein [Planctomycetes bacterium]|nr:dual specificity protein phosphatase family protein [Planctomycetota bacterium]
MKLGSFYVLLALLLALASFRLPNAAPITLWVAADLFLVGLAYLGLGPRLLGKRSDGGVAFWAILLLFPYLFGIETVWRLRRLFPPASPFQELIPGIYIGRRLFPHEYPAAVDCIVDLTCELSEFRGVRPSRFYVCLPILDGHVPKLADLLNLIGRIDAMHGTVYVHCAEGYGRTGMVAASILLAKGLADDPDEAIRTVQRKRPGVCLGRAQRRAVARVAQALGATERTNQPSPEDPTNR